jgi:hypothetical protein
MPVNVELREVMEHIQRHWAWVVWPKADRELDNWEWDAVVAAEFAGYSMWNLGDGFNYSKCYTYAILLHPGQYRYPESLAEELERIRRFGGQQYTLLLKLSVIAPYYLAKILLRTLDGHGNRVEEEMRSPSEEHAALLRRAEEFAERQGFVRIPREYLAVLVPGAELELAQPGEVTVYNCLFEDEFRL